MTKAARDKDAGEAPGDEDTQDSGVVRRRGRGSTAVYEDLREDILTLRIAPGTALDEVALAERFGLSRTPIREALLMLSREDMVTFLQGRSAVVTPHTMSNAHEYMDTLMLLSRAIARLAGEESSEAAMAEIQRLRYDYERISDGGEPLEIALADLAFHRAISFASGNEFLGKFYRLSLDYGRRMQLLHYYPIYGAAERETAMREHAALAAAIAAGEGEACETIAGEHVMSELRVVQRSLEPKVGTRFSLGSGWRNTP
jgi:DNA-binding GntR family transcriptional regulator